MRIIGKVCFLAALIFGVMNAEESGGFVGVQLGGGELTMESSAKGLSGSVNGITNGTSKIGGGGVALGIVGGYKQFFTQYLGLRYYANVDFIIANVKSIDSNAKGIYGYDDWNTNLINYGVNVDFLANFISNETLDFGGFIGLGLGGSTYMGDGIDKLQDFINGYANVLNVDGELSKTGFDLALNIGLRVNIAQNHGVEVAARVPFIKTTLLEKNISGAKITFTAHNPYRIVARYAYSF